MTWPRQWPEIWPATPPAAAPPAGFKSAWARQANSVIGTTMRRNVASQVIGVQMVSATDGSAFTGTVSCLVTVNGGTQTASAGTGPTHEGNGFHSYVPTSGETNGAHVAFTFTGSGAVPATVQVYPMAYGSTGVMDANATQLAGQTVTAGAGVTFPASVASPTNITAASGVTLAAVTHTGAVIPTVSAVTGLTAANLDAAVSSRMASYTQPSGFLAATFPGTVASTTNITSATGINVTQISGSAAAADNLEAHALRAVSVTFAAGGTTTTAVLALVDGATASSVDDVYNGRVLIFSAPANLKDQATSITDYVGATKTATIVAVTNAPVATAAAVMV